MRISPSVARSQDTRARPRRPSHNKRKRPSRPWCRYLATAREIKSHFQFWYGVRRDNRYIGGVLPDDDAGRDDAALMLHYLAHAPTYSELKGESFLRDWCPWISESEREHILWEAATAPPPRFTADELADRLGVTYAERQARGYRQIGAIDVPKPERERRRRMRDQPKGRQRQEDARRANGAKPRAQYLAESISRAQPWVAEGVSRRTWYRRRAVAQVRPSICLRECADGLVPPSTRPDRLTAQSSARQREQPRGLSDDTHVIDPSTSRCMPCSS
jgi:hypothetical protein